MPQYEAFYVIYHGELSRHVICHDINYVSFHNTYEYNLNIFVSVCKIIDIIKSYLTTITLTTTLLSFFSPAV